MIKALIILDNDLVNDGRVLKEISILEKNNIDYRVLCFDQGKDYAADSKIIRIKKGNLIKTKLQPIVNSFPLATVIWKRHINALLKTFKADLIHIHDLYMLPPVYLAVKRLRSRPKLVLDLHENYPYAILNYEYAQKGLKKYFVRPSQWMKKEKSILSHADTVIVLDKEFAEILQEKYPTLNTKTFVEFPNYPDYAKLDLAEPIDFTIKNESPVMLYFGGIAKSRGITETISAFKKVIESGRKANFLIIGPINKAYESEFLRLISDPVIKDNIQFVPWIKLPQLKSVMNKCSFAIAPFHVNPQIESGIANKIFQYLYGELPVIVSNARPMATLVKENECGLVFETSHDLEENISTYIDNMELVKEHGKNGRRTIQQKYPAEKFEKKLMEVYGIV